MSRKPDPKKAIYLKPNQRRRGRKKQQPRPSQWQPHHSDQALDGWSVALRTLRERGLLDE